ncbi:MAG: hypothetical protein MZV63_60265 [Marinilabiliales bacterium]|nr:hypothetical protein [Marinilabiliales bacterium]
MADITAGSVTLVLTATSFVPCPPVSDSMVLSISRQAIVNAGPSDSICETQPSYLLSGATGIYFTSLTWTTSGTGSFTNPAILNPAYLPSAADIAAGSVVLTPDGHKHTTLRGCSILDDAIYYSEPHCRCGA